ncbi:putative Proteasome endopeptidase complex [Rhodotorula taiwanensis]|uniref:Proteasome subunit beta n=1 Tax=Rhodotorula taiwanensis TaxID=741276 RepID=A0A2S5B1W1_9BASI|nr:putative Proteasome endopeptidase complex [Rhodotorula taiwanensis]
MEVPMHSTSANILTPDVSPLKAGEMNLGTSIMAVAFDGGVVVGADSRTSMGAYIANRVTDKLTYLHERIYCCRSGSAADTQAVADVVHAQLSQYAITEGKRPSVHVAANMLQSIIYSNKDRLSAGIIVAGWDEDNGGTVYNIPLGGGTFKAPWAIAGSGSTYVYGYCDATYREDSTKEETVDFVRDTLALAMSRDGSSGGTIRMAIITKEGVERVFVPGDQLPRFWEKA